MNSFIIIALAMVGGLLIAITSNLDPTLGATSTNYNNIEKVGGKKTYKRKKNGRKSRRI